MNDPADGPAPGEMRTDHCLYHTELFWRGRVGSVAWWEEKSEWSGFTGEKKASTCRRGIQTTAWSSAAKGSKERPWIQEGEEAERLWLVCLYV